jgi:type IV pilus assembly protein PilC
MKSQTIHARQRNVFSSIPAASKKKGRIELHVQWPFHKKASDRDKARLYSALSVLLEAGLDMAQALHLLVEQKPAKVWAKVLPKVEQNMLAGQGLSDALEQTKLFSAYEITSLRIGEETGYLQPILKQMEVYFEDRIRLRRLIVGALSYPIMVLTITAGTVYFMLRFIVPMFATIFARFNRELPPLTQGVIAVSEWIGTYGGWLMGTIGLLVGVHLWAKKHQIYRSIGGNLLLKMPLVGTTIQKVQLARISNAMYFLIHAENPLVKSLELTAQMLSFYPYRKLLQQTAEKVMHGIALSDAIHDPLLIPKQAQALIRVGEEANQLGKVFEKLAQQYQKEIEYQTQVISKVLEPLLILLVASIVGLVLVAMYMPLFSLGGVMG